MFRIYVTVERTRIVVISGCILEKKKTPPEIYENPEMAFLQNIPDVNAKCADVSDNAEKNIKIILIHPKRRWPVMR